MGKSGGGGQTVVQNNQPPQQFLDAFQNAVTQAKNVSSVPYQQYPGNRVAGFSPDQVAGMRAIEGSFGMAAPYINTAADYLSSATAPVLPTLQPYIDQARGIYSSAGTPFVSQNFDPGSVGAFYSPYVNDVVNATQNLFNQQNAEAANNLRGNAVSAGAFGGDREAVAQGELARQQQLAQAPTLAGLRNTGYQTAMGQALSSFQADQQRQLQAQEAARQMGLAGAQGIAGLGGQALGAEEAQRWLQSQAAYGMANLGNQALNTTLTGANQLLGIGGLQQQQAQQLLNVPYADWLAQVAYPFQTTGWLSNISEGLGGAAGGTSSTTSPGPSTASQILGLGASTAGLLGSTGAFGNNGWLTGSGGLFGSGAGAATSGGLDAAMVGAGVEPSLVSDIGSMTGGLFGIRDGGRVPHRAAGGPMMAGSAPWSSVPAPWDVPGPVPASHPMGGKPLILGNYGTSSSSGGGGSGGQDAMTAIKDVAQIAGLVAMFLRDGGRVPHRDSGGEVSVTMSPGTGGGKQVPHLAISPLNLTPMGSTEIPAAAGALGAGAMADDPRIQAYLAGTLGGASFAKPQVYVPPPPAPPPPQMLGGPGQDGMPLFFGPGNEGGMGDVGSQAAMDAAAAAAGGMDVAGAHDVGQTELAAEAAGSAAGAGAGGGGGGLGGLYAKGGRLGLQDGGTADDYDYDVTPDEEPLMQSQLFRGEPKPVPGSSVPPMPDVGAAISQGPYGTTLPDVRVSARRPMGAAPAAQEDVATTTPMGAPVRSAGEPIQPTKGDPWRALMYAGLGIMGGSSPYAAVNIGRGALAGAKQYETERHREVSESQVAQRLANLADSYALRERQAGNLQDYRDTRLGQFQQAIDQRQALADRTAELRAQGMSATQAVAQAKLDLARKTLELHQQTAGTQAGQRDRSLDLQQQANEARIANSREAMAQRERLAAAGHDAAAQNAILGDASRLIASGMAKAQDLPKLVDQLAEQRKRLAPSPTQTQQPTASLRPPTTAELAQARAAIAAGKDSGAVANRLRENGIDPSGL